MLLIMKMLVIMLMIIIKIELVKKENTNIMKMNIKKNRNIKLYHIIYMIIILPFLYVICNIFILVHILFV